MDELADVRASQAGDRVAFGSLIDRYYKSIYRFAYQYTGNHQDADDVCQETFLRAFGNIKKLRDVSYFKKWIFAIALNLLRKLVKETESGKELAGKTANSALAELTDDKNTKPFEILSMKEKAMVIQKQLQKMPEHMRLVSILVLMEGLTQKDAAGVLKCSEATISRHLDAARKLLQAKLQNLL